MDRNRMRPRLAFSLALAAFSTLATPLQAAPPQPDSPAAGIERPRKTLLPEQVHEQLAKLADPSWVIRQAAQDELVALGPDILPILALARAESADLQAHAAIRLIETQIADNLARVGRPVFVHLADADAAAALREIADQAGFTLTIDDRRLQGVRVNGEIDGASFWQAILQISASHDLDLRPVESGLRATRATEGAARTVGGPASTSGPMIILARGAHYERKLTLDRDPASATLADTPAAAQASERFRYEFEALLEPRFLIGSRRFTVILTRAQDDAGNVLHAAGAADGADLRRELAEPAAGAGDDPALAAAISEAAFTGGRLKFDIDLDFPQSPGRQLRLEGRIRGLVGAEISQMKAAAIDLAGGAAWHVAGERTEISLEPSAAAGRWTLSMTSARAVTPEVGDLLAVSMATAELLDAAGDRFRRGALQSTTGDDGRLTLRLEFIGPADGSMLPRQLTCRVPRCALELDVPFEFDNLPVP
jgi:hypothetical protein